MSKRGIVYNAYLKHLVNNNKQDVAHNFDNCRFDAWFLYNYNYQNPALSAVNLTFQEAIGDTTCEYLGALNNAKLETVSTIDGLEAELSYEALFNTPVSAYLFSEQDKPKTGTMIERDIYYETFDYTVYDAKKYDYDMERYPCIAGYENHSNGRRPVDEDNSEYDNYLSFISHFSEYGFNSGYDPSEYRIYGIAEEPACEDQINLKVDNSSFTVKDGAFVGNGILVTWYNGERATENERGYIFNEPKNPDSCIPCAYFQLPLSYRPGVSKLKVEWSDNGLFSVK